MGALFVLLSLIYYVLEIDVFSIGFSILNLLIMIGIYIGFLLYSNKTLKTKQLNGRLSYWDGVLNGFLTGIVAAVIGMIYNYVFIKYFDPEFMTKAFEKTMEMLESNPNIPQEMVEKAYKDMEAMTPVKYALQGLKMNLIISIIFALIISAFTRTKNDEFIEDVVIDEKSE
jgi:hypothetical protein